MEATRSVKITVTHVRIALAIIAVSASATLASLFSGLAEIDPLPTPLDIVFPAALAFGGVLMPLIGMVGATAAPYRLRAGIFFALPLFCFAAFLAPELNVFPVRALSMVGGAVSFVVLIVVVFTALEHRPHRTPSTPSRFDS
jgi:hypothetical protein